MTSKGFGFLRPYLFRDARPLPEAACRSHLRFHAVTRHCKRSNATASDSASAREVPERAVKLKASGQLHYPRMDRDFNALAISSFRNRFERLQLLERPENTRVTVRGRSSWAIVYLDAFVDGFRKGAVYPHGRGEASFRQYSAR